MPTEHEVSREELQAEVQYYADQVRKYKAGLRYCLALIETLPPPNVREEDIESMVKNAEFLGVKA